LILRPCRDLCAGDYERRLEAARDRRQELEDEVEGVRRDWDEMRRQMDEDLDKEVEGMRRGCVGARRGRCLRAQQWELVAQSKLASLNSVSCAYLQPGRSLLPTSLCCRYTEKLEAERDATLKFKGENGIMMKKFAALSKEMDEVGACQRGAERGWRIDHDVLLGRAVNSTAMPRGGKHTRSNGARTRGLRFIPLVQVAGARSEAALEPPAPRHVRATFATLSTRCSLSLPLSLHYLQARRSGA
jgi:hypothetical protein